MRRAMPEIAEAFSRHRFEETYASMNDDIEWLQVGETQIHGKVNVVRACEESAKYLASVRTTFTAFKVIAGQDCVVVDSRAEYEDGEHGSARVASCDIYDFVDGSLVEITSYAVELEPSSE
jgi:hypothetical protein